MNIPALTRRDALKVGVLGTAALTLPFTTSLSAKSASRIATSKLGTPYTRPFTIPTVATPGTHANYPGADFYVMRQKAGVAEILPGVQTPVWGYNGLVPGPTIHATRGKRVVMRQINNLPATHPTLGYVPWTSTHLHGSPSLPQYDGYASDITQPGVGQWKDYIYENPQQARTLWYHDHGVHHTAENVYMGLAAQYLLREPTPDPLLLPRGKYDVPLIISDKMFAADGSLLWDDLFHSGVFGDVITVNGRAWPTMKVERRKYRFRVLNASISRGYRLALSDASPMIVIGTDGGLMQQPQTVTEFKIGMAERYEIVIDFARYAIGAKVRLTNKGVKNSIDFDHTGKVMQFEVAAEATDRTYNSVPAVLDPNAAAMNLQPADAVVKRNLRLKKDNEVWTVDGVVWDDIVASGYTKVFGKPVAGTTEMWTVENSSGGWFHPLHIHLIDFKVVDRNGAPPPPHERGPKDVIYIGEGEKIRLLMHFADHEKGRYMIHCHNLTHEDHDMMTQFEVVSRDGSPGDDPIMAALPKDGPDT